MQMFRVIVFVSGFVFLSCITIAQTWEMQNSGVSVNLRNVKAVSPSVCWAAGDEGTVVFTIDSGKTWNSVGGGIIGTIPVYAMTAVSDSIAMVSTTSPTATYIYRTTDAGTTWAEAYSLVVSGAFINAIRMFDKSNGIAVGDPVSGKFLILKTTNSGESWSELSTEPDANANEYGVPNSLCVRDNNFIWLGTLDYATGNGRVIFSTDLGANWTESSTPFSAVRGVWFNDPLVGLITGDNSTTSGIAKSIDGGKTWSSISGDYNFQAVVGDGLQKYYAMGSASGGGYGIYVSPDTSFKWDSLFVYNGLLDISVGRDGGYYFGWAVGYSGTIVRFSLQITGIDEGSSVVPGFVLYQNYPNPFNPTTKIKFKIGKSGNTSIKVYDLLGKEVSTLVDRYFEKGNYEIEFNAEHLSTGIYFYQIISGNYIDTKKLILLK